MDIDDGEASLRPSEDQDSFNWYLHILVAYEDNSRLAY